MMQVPVPLTPKIRYFAKPSNALAALRRGNGYSEFLRTGIVERYKDDWDHQEERFLTYEEVAERTGRKLQDAGLKTHERLNAVHKDIQFPKLVYHRTLAHKPHLGYCHVTAARSKFAEFEDVRWAFYIANFNADLDKENFFFDVEDIQLSRLYFAIAVDLDRDENKLVIDRKVRGNGVLFSTHDPHKAMKNVLMMGAKEDRLRRKISAL